MMRNGNSLLSSVSTSSSAYLKRIHYLSVSPRVCPFHLLTLLSPYSSGLVSLQSWWLPSPLPSHKHCEMRCMLMRRLCMVRGKEYMGQLYTFHSVLLWTHNCSKKKKSLLNNFSTLLKSLVAFQINPRFLRMIFKAL